MHSAYSLYIIRISTSALSDGIEHISEDDGERCEDGTEEEEEHNWDPCEYGRHE